MPSVLIRPYQLEVSLQGFRTQVLTGIVLRVDTSPVITTLALGGLEESITVEAAALWSMCAAPGSARSSSRRASWRCQSMPKQ